jgi:hypothetical protein
MSVSKRTSCFRVRTARRTGSSVERATKRVESDQLVMLLQMSSISLWSESLLLRTPWHSRWYESPLRVAPASPRPSARRRGGSRARSRPSRRVERQVMAERIEHWSLLRHFSTRALSPRAPDDAGERAASSMRRADCRLDRSRRTSRGREGYVKTITDQKRSGGSERDLSTGCNSSVPAFLRPSLRSSSYAALESAETAQRHDRRFPLVRSPSRSWSKRLNHSSALEESSSSADSCCLRR